MPESPCVSLPLRYIKLRNFSLLFPGRYFSERKIPYDTVVAANFADSKCEASEKSDSFALSVSYKCLVLY